MNNPLRKLLFLFLTITLTQASNAQIGLNSKKDKRSLHSIVHPNTPLVVLR
ncbi:hypothetical protein EMGBS15_09090 [Filimonas sp.]|nr:hypothetical protein EMGBS15_09090 [Filimonas sp.]